MNNKIINIGLFIILMVLTGMVFLKIKHRNEYQQKLILAQEMRKALEHLMIDLSQARPGSLQDVPNDGQWHNRLEFESRGQGLLVYTIHNGNLYKQSHGQEELIADYIDLLRIRRQQTAPDIIEVQVEARNNMSLTSNLELRVSR